MMEIMIQKVDIYSLGVVFHELFDIGNNLNRNDDLDEYFEEIEDLVEKDEQDQLQEKTEL